MLMEEYVKSLHKADHIEETITPKIDDNLLSIEETLDDPYSKM